jgi:hypothetical protein
MTQLISKAFSLFDETNGSRYEQLGARTFALEMANNGYAEICRETHCAWASSPISTEAGIREYALPLDCAVLDYVTCQSKAVKAMLHKDISLGASGPPGQYYLVADKIGFDVTPNGGYQVDLWYFAGPSTDLPLDQTPVLIPDRWQYVLAYYITRRLFETDKGANPRLAGVWQKLYAEELIKMRDHFRLGGNGSEIPEVP